MTKNTLIVVVVIVLALLAIVYFRVQKPVDYEPQPVRTSTSPSPADDTTAAINNDLGEIDLGDIDGEFDAIDSDLNSL